MAVRFSSAKLWLGGDSRVREGLLAGAVGSITAGTNAVPELVGAVHAAHRRGDAAGAEAAQMRLSAVRGRFDPHALPAAAKALLRARGLDAGPVRPPLCDLDVDAAEQLIDAVRSDAPELEFSRQR